MHHAVERANIRGNDVGSADLGSTGKIYHEWTCAGAEGGDVLAVRELGGEHLAAGDVEQQHLGELGWIGEQPVEGGGRERSESCVGGREDGERSARRQSGVEAGDAKRGSEGAQVGVGSGESADRLTVRAGGDGTEFVDLKEGWARLDGGVGDEPKGSRIDS